MLCTQPATLGCYSVTCGCITTVQILAVSVDSCSIIMPNSHSVSKGNVILDWLLWMQVPPVPPGYGLSLLKGSFSFCRSLVYLKSFASGIGFSATCSQFVYTPQLIKVDGCTKDTNLCLLLTIQGQV